jgi:hypothetical protein
MQCIECKQPFKPTRADIKLCSKCRQARNRRLHRKPRAEMRRDDASYQMAKRLVAEYALLRPGTQPNGINATRLRQIRSVIAASTWL